MPNAKPRKRQPSIEEIHLQNRRIAYRFIDYNITLSIYEYRLYHQRPTNWPEMQETYFELLYRAETEFNFN
ncbi:MAG: hypothetical protein ACM3QX_18350 [Syntrophomonadaceae bacterium]